MSRPRVDHLFKKQSDGGPGLPIAILVAGFCLYCLFYVWTR